MSRNEKEIDELLDVGKANFDNLNFVPYFRKNRSKPFGE
jgi:hypothetical protein